MKKSFLLFICSLLISGLFAQSDSTKSDKKIKSKAKVLFSINSDMWLNAENDIDIKPISLGMELFSVSKKYFGKSPVGIMYGLGVTCHNINYNMFLSYDTLNRTVLSKIPDSLNTKKNKLSVSYLDIPLEIFFSPKKGKSFNISAGMKAGYLINTHTKYKGKNPDGSGNDLKTKTANIKNVEPFRYGITGRIGYGAVSISCYYSLSSLFKEDKARLKEFTPFTIGITFLFL
ncbi:MAG: outer membrane beta-barrel protein [Bacteroidales bacterium]|nr:outer membrane beta-barrel protein [Bacteroidales bacterium]